MKNEEIRKTWDNFINDINFYKYIGNNIDIWNDKFNELKIYIDTNNKLPLYNDTVSGFWFHNQKKIYKTKIDIMKNEDIYNKWKNFLEEYQEYFPDNSAIKQSSKKSTTIKPKIESNQNNIIDNKAKQLSNYQELSKKMSLQKSSTTKEMFIKEPN
jgi:hypothetical protein